jgi:hypothetical protein
MNTVRNIADSVAKLSNRWEGADPNFARAFAASRCSRDMKKLLAVLAVAAVMAPSALAASVRAQHPYARSHEAGDYKFCERGTGVGIPGCAFDSMEQCLADRAGKGGYCYAK